MATAATTASAALAPVGTPPTRIIVASDATLAGGAAVGDDGRIFHHQNPELRVYPPGASGIDPQAKVITGLGSDRATVPSYDPERGLAMAIGLDGEQQSIVVIDPDQPSGPAVPTRTITGPATLIENPVAVSWTRDGSLWVVSGSSDGTTVVQALVRFPSGADGNVALDRVITGDATGLGGLDLAAVDSLPDGSAVIGAIGAFPGVLVFGPDQNGNTKPARRFTPTLPTSYLQFGVAADSRGRIYVPSGDVLGTGPGKIAVYASGADGAVAPEVELTGAASGLHLVAFPALGPDDRLVVTDATLAFGQLTTVRLLEFAPLPAAPSRPRSLRAKHRPTSSVFTWKAPADTGGAGVNAYQVAITKGTRTVRTVSLPGTKRRYVVPTRRLPKGSFKVRVTALNVAGPGPTTTKSFRGGRP